MTQQMDLTEKKPAANGANDTPLPATVTPAVAAAAAIVLDDEPSASGGDEPSRVLSAFSSENTFNVAQRMAKALAASSLLPETFRGNVPNCMIAMELANRIGCSVFMICQNMDVIHGRPGLRAKFLIATVNASGRFTPLRFRWQGKPGSEDRGCQAYATDKQTGVPCDGPWITWELAKAEGWVSKSGSKWKTMPEKMFMYRAGAWWSDLYCPELAMGMGTAEEAIDAYGETVHELPSGLRPGNTAALQSALMKPDVVTADGEVIRASDAHVLPSDAALHVTKRGHEALAAEAKADEQAHAAK